MHRDALPVVPPSARSALLFAGALVGFAALVAARRRARHRVRGKVVLITGGSRGLGLELARELGARGARVVVVARDGDELLAARADLARRGITALALRCDVTDPEDIVAAVARTRQLLGPVDVLVNNAGTIVVGPAEHTTDDDFRRALDVHFWGPLHATAAVLPEMRRRRRGHVVNIGSIGGAVALPHMLAYSASKHALVGLSHGLAAELPRDGITVTTVLPARVRTGGARFARFKGRHRNERAWFKLSRFVPGFAVSAPRAARQIRRAIERGRREVTLGRATRAAIAAEGLAPGLVVAAFALVSRLLPRPGGIGADWRTGRESAPGQGIARPGPAHLHTW